MVGCQFAQATERSPRRSAPLDLVRLSDLMALTSGRPEIAVGLIDGPVAGFRFREVDAGAGGRCIQRDSGACMHGTFVAGVLCAQRDSAAPAICPGCSLLVRPIFAEAGSWNDAMPGASAGELAAAIIDCVAAGARIINLSAALVNPAPGCERRLEEALGHAAAAGVLIVAAAGNQGTVGGSAITRHAWVLPVAACDGTGRLLRESNLGSSIGRFGLRAPGERITSLGGDGKPLTLSGTSAAAPFVTGTLALLWSLYPSATPAQIRFSVLRGAAPRSTIMPPLLDAWAAHQFLGATVH